MRKRRMKAGGVATVCRQELFTDLPGSTKGGSFSAPSNGISGSWQIEAASTTEMAWTSVPDTGLLSFSGRFLSTTSPAEFKGSASEGVDKIHAKLVIGAVPGC
jgi:hypothetical protein